MGAVRDWPTFSNSMDTATSPMRVCGSAIADSIRATHPASSKRKVSLLCIPAYYFLKLSRATSLARHHDASGEEAGTVLPQVPAVVFGLAFPQCRVLLLIGHPASMSSGDVDQVHLAGADRLGLSPAQHRLRPPA